MNCESKHMVFEYIISAFTKDYPYNLSGREYALSLFKPYNDIILKTLRDYISMPKTPSSTDKPVSCCGCSLITTDKNICSICKKIYCNNCPGSTDLLYILGPDSGFTEESQICKTCTRILSFMDKLIPESERIPNPKLESSSKSKSKSKKKN